LLFTFASREMLGIKLLTIGAAIEQEVVGPSEIDASPRPGRAGRQLANHDTIALTKLKEEMRLRQQRHAAGPRPAHEPMTPKIKMIVSYWYTDELGNQARFIKARD
jgi:hypothetical protein